MLVVEGSYTRWGYNKPNNYDGYQTCVVMHSGVGYKFDDDKCGQTAASYICEIRNYIHYNDSVLTRFFAQTFKLTFSNSFHEKP